MKKFLKVIYLLIASVLTFTMLAGCFGSNSDPNTTLTVWTTSPLIDNYESVLKQYPDNTNALLTKWVVDEFKEMHPEAELKLSDQGWGSKLNEALIRAKNSRSIPDIIAEEAYLASHQALGIIMPIADEANLTTVVPELSDMDQAQLDPVTIDGQLYSAPVFTGVLGLYYNENLLREYEVFRPGTSEVFIPQTFTELLEASRMLYVNSKGTKGGTMISFVGDGSASFRALGYLRQGGAEIVDERLPDNDLNYKLAVNSKESKSVMEYLNLLGCYGLNAWQALEDENSIYQEFYSGNAGFMVESNYLLYQLRFTAANKPYSHIKYTALPSCDINGKTLAAYEVDSQGNETKLREFTFAADATTPPADGKNANVFIGNLSYSFGNNDSMKNPEKFQLAVDFIRLLYSEEFQSMLLTHDGRIPVLTSVQNDIIESTADTTDYDKFIQESKFAIESVQNDYIPGAVPSFTTNPADVWTIWSQFFRTTVAKSSAQPTTQEAIRAACDEAQMKMKNKLDT